MVHLTLLGYPTVERVHNNHRVHCATGTKRLGLLACAAVSPGGIRRDTATALLWAESPADRARANLRQLLTSIRVELGEDIFVGPTAEKLVLSREEVCCDVWRFRQSLDEGDTETAVQCYGGTLLDGFHLSGCSEWDLWIERWRLRLRAEACRAAWVTATRYQEVGWSREAVRQIRFALDQDPLNEPGLRQLLRMLEARGDRAGVAGAYRAFERRLEMEFGVEPDPGTKALANRILYGEMPEV